MAVDEAGEDGAAPRVEPLVGGGGLGGRGGVATTGTGAVTDDGEGGADLDGLVLLDQDLLEHAGDRRGDLRVDLVGRDLQQGLVDGDGVADGLEPSSDGALGDGLAECRELHVLRHDLWSLLRSVGQATCRGEPGCRPATSGVAAFWSLPVILSPPRGSPQSFGAPGWCDAGYT